jgi:secreted Zn-dependent insulinase-like peptidase
VALEKPSWTVSEQLTALLTINKRDFFRYASQLFSKVHLKSFAYGNIDSQRAINYTWKVVHGLGLKLARLSLLAQRVDLQPGDNYIYRMKVSDTDNTNSAIKSVYQVKCCIE